MHRKSLFGNFLEDGYGSPKFFSENPRSSTELSLEVSLFQSLVKGHSPSSLHSRVSPAPHGHSPVSGAVT